MTRQQLDEYATQLSEIETLLASDPTDASLIKLRDDLVELIALTRSELEGGAAVGGDESKQGAEQDMSSTEGSTHAGSSPTAAAAVAPSEPTAAESSSPSAEPSSAAAAAAGAAPVSEPPKKKAKTKKSKPPPSQFEVPPHLLPLPNDTPAETNRKKRTLKALKSKWRERVKEAQSQEKQKSWQDFVGKGKKKKKAESKSIFATEDGIHARVGVISGASGGRKVTGYGERKRHQAG